MSKVDSSKILLSQQPDLSWAPSTMYHWEDLIQALNGMSEKGVGGVKFWLGNAGDDPKYGMVSVAAFLAQSMKETIQYDACDENNWDIPTGYAAANACGQRGQSYQDYKCPAGQEDYECKVDPNMTIRGVTQARWYGAPPAFFCAPRSKLPAAPRWSYSGSWCDPSKPHDSNMNLEQYLAYVASAGKPGVDSCRDYPGQKDGRWTFASYDSAHVCTNAGCPNDPAPAFGRAARTDVEGCCWWGRGVIQTTGVCNFGKLDFFLGARAQREGREALFPDVDFCQDPGQICSTSKYPELKWVAGLYYYMTEVQPWNSGGYNYLAKLRAFVDTGMRQADRGFIDGVSGIVNRGCAATTCNTGPVDGLDQRAQNFRIVLQSMKLVEV